MTHGNADILCTPCMMDNNFRERATGQLNSECYWYVCERHFISASAVGGFRARRFDGSSLTPYQAVQLAKKKPA